MKTIKIHQIYYNQETKDLINPGFIPLDNTENQRPDWAELWVIRKYLLENELDENHWYGFFSPKFKEKSGYSSSEALEFINSAPQEADVIHFLPFWDMTAYFMNCFEQGNHWHPGLKEVSSDFFNEIGFHDNVNNIVMSSDRTIFCNYFVAKPKFWMRWLKIADHLFNCSESKKHHLFTKLNEKTFHSNQKNYSFKVFIQERIASFLLNTESWSTYSPVISNKKISIPEFQKFRGELIICDALKSKYIQTKDTTYIAEYFTVRNKIIDLINQNKQ